MQLLATVFMAVVSTNCLLLVINGQSSEDTFALPYIDALLPPLEDNPAENSKTPDKVNHTTTTTTKTAIIHNDNISLPELSIEALLPPLFEAQMKTEDSTTTTQISSITTTTSATATSKSSRKIAAILTPVNLKIPDLSLDPFVPPLLNDNDSLDTRAEEIITTTNKAIITTITPYEQQQKTNIRNEDNKRINKPEKQKQKHLQDRTVSNEVSVRNNNLLADSNIVTDKNVVADKTKVKQVPAANSDNQQAKIEIVTNRYDYNFDLYLGSTTPRPIKSGLPTITPFPNRLGS